MAWYSLMISEDKESEIESSISLLDYHASFTNYEGVKKAKEYRDSLKETSIQEASEFIESAKTNEFKNNPLIDIVKKMRESAKTEKEDDAFSSINLNKLIKENF